jgi:secretion/DNA translocation related TadE-like protein
MGHEHHLVNDERSGAFAERLQAGELGSLLGTFDRRPRCVGARLPLGRLRAGAVTRGGGTRKRARSGLPRSALRQDRGSGTVWMIALMALVWLVAVVAMSIGGVRAARHRAHAAADLAALAAASHAIEGSARACGVAAAIARAVRGRLTECALRGRVADVTVVAASRVPGFGALHVRASARAGPVRRPAVESRVMAVRARSVAPGARFGINPLLLASSVRYCKHSRTTGIIGFAGHAAQCQRARTTKGSTP